MNLNKGRDTAAVKQGIRAVVFKWAKKKKKRELVTSVSSGVPRVQSICESDLSAKAQIKKAAIL